MDRRSFIRKAALGGTAAAASSLAAPALAQGIRTLTMVTSWPVGLSGVWDSVERFSKNVADISDGTLLIDPKGADQPGAGLQSFDSVSSGQADMYHAADYYFIGQHPGFAYFTAAPFGMTAPEMMTWYYGEDGLALHHELGEIFNLRSFIAGQTGAQGGGWFREPISTVEDLQGLKFRMPGLGGQALSTLGVSVQTLPGGEIYQALATGAIDATEWIGPWSDEKLGLQEICKNYYAGGFHEPGAALSVACNLDVFNSLTPSQQRAIEVSAADAHQHNYSLFIANNGPALVRLKAAGVTTHEFSPEIWDAFGRASKEVLDGYMGDPLFAKIRASAEASLANSSGWMGLSDNFYTAQRNRVRGL
jgi:TRAP-type mannitol/chloroaromatic compound transport system substrate-binding protein